MLNMRLLLGYTLSKIINLDKKIATYSVAKRERHQQVDVSELSHITGPGMFVMCFRPNRNIIM